MIALEKIPPEFRSMAVKPVFSAARHFLKRTGEAGIFNFSILHMAIAAGAEYILPFRRFSVRNKQMKSKLLGNAKSIFAGRLPSIFSYTIKYSIVFLNVN